MPVSEPNAAVRRYRALVFCALLAFTVQSAMLQPPAWAQAADAVSPNLALHLRRVEFRVISGRLTATSRTQGGRVSSTTNLPERQEELTIDFGVGMPTVFYRVTTPAAQVTINLGQGDQFEIVRQPHSRSVMGEVSQRNSAAGGRDDERGAAAPAGDPLAATGGDAEDRAASPRPEAPREPVAPREQAAPHELADPAAAAFREDDDAVRSDDSDDTRPQQLSRGEIDDSTAPDDSDDVASPHHAGATAPGQELLRFAQQPGEWLLLELGEGEDKRSWSAPTLWHLLLAAPDVARDELLPLLGWLRPDWQLAEAASEIEAAMLTVASSTRPSERHRWSALVTQLASPRFAERRAAFRQLRAVGQAVLPYLQSLPVEMLDAEQRAQVRRLVTQLGAYEGEDLPARATTWMVEDPWAWYFLLGRDDPAVTRLAVAPLSALLEVPVTFDPTATDSLRETQLEAIRRQIEASGAAATR